MSIDAHGHRFGYNMTRRFEPIFDSLRRTRMVSPTAQLNVVQAAVFDEMRYVYYITVTDPLGGKIPAAIEKTWDTFEAMYDELYKLAKVREKLSPPKPGSLAGGTVTTESVNT